MKVPPGVNAAPKLVFGFSDPALKQRLSARLCASYGRWLGGFRTLEVRNGGARDGFEIETLDGERSVLASRGMISAVSFNKYALNLDALDVTALSALEAAAAGGKVLLFDELGPMAMKSEKFSARAVELLFSPAPCLVFYRRGAAVFENAFSKMSGTVIIELTGPGWAEAVAAAEAWLDRLAAEMEMNKK